MTKASATTVDHHTHLHRRNIIDSNKLVIFLTITTNNITINNINVWLDALEEKLFVIRTSLTIISLGTITHLSLLLNSHTCSCQAIIYLLHHLNLSIMVTSPKGAKLKGTCYCTSRIGLSHSYTVITFTAHIHV